MIHLKLNGSFIGAFTSGNAVVNYVGAWVIDAGWSATQRPEYVISRHTALGCLKEHSDFAYVQTLGRPTWLKWRNGLGYKSRIRCSTLGFSELPAAVNSLFARGLSNCHG